jgi:hypothetical protein
MTKIVTTTFHVQDMLLVPPPSRLIQGYRFVDLINVLYLVLISFTKIVASTIITIACC